MSKASIFQLIALKKGVDRTRLEQLLAGLRLEHADLGERCRYIDQVAEEYEFDTGSNETAVRFDGPALAGRRYLVQLMNMKNAVIVKQMDLEVKMDRLRNALQQLDVDCQRFDKLDALQTEQRQRESDRRLQREEDGFNLLHYNNRRGND
jgi:hypothetical protein